MNSWKHHRARVANAVQRGDVAAETEARRDLRATRAEAYVRQLIEEPPPLTSEQIRVIRDLLDPTLPMKGTSTS